MKKARHEQKCMNAAILHRPNITLPGLTLGYNPNLHFYCALYSITKLLQSKWLNIVSNVNIELGNVLLTTYSSSSHHPSLQIQMIKVEDTLPLQ